MNGALISICRTMQKFAKLSMTEAEIVAVIIVVQHMVYAYLLLESLKFKVELPIVLEMDNSRLKILPAVVVLAAECNM